MAQLEKGIIDTCVFLFTELSSIETTVEQEMSLSDVLKFSAARGLDFIKQALKDLLAIKRNFLLLDGYSEYNAELLYQKALQKLEGEVRNHIKIEQQLKIQLETLQSKLEDTKKKHRSESDKLKQQNQELEARLSEALQMLEGQKCEPACNCKKTDKKPESKENMCEPVRKAERPASALRGIRIPQDQAFSYFKNQKRARQSIRRPLSSQANKSNKQ